MIERMQTLDDFERPITDPDFMRWLARHYPAKVRERIEGLLRPNSLEPAVTPINNIPNAIRARLKQLYTDPNRTWDWDEGHWDSELSLHDAQEELDCGYVVIIPIMLFKDGKRFF
jgi:hypothetical protein